MQSWPATAGGGEDAAGSPGGPELLRRDVEGWRRKGRKRRERHVRKSCRDLLALMLELRPRCWVLTGLPSQPG